MQPTWYIQSSINIEKHDRIFDICENLNIPFVSLPIIPFTTEVPDDIEYIHPAIPYGTCKYVRLSKKHPILSKNTWYDKDLLNSAKYYQALGDKYLNEPLFHGTVRDLPIFDEVFLKSNADLKEITGGVYTKENITELKDALKGTDSELYYGGDIISLDTVVYCSSLKNLEYETRNIFVNGEWITGSFYRQEQKMKRERLQKDKHSDIINFAKDCIDIYNPFPVTVIDVGMSDNGLKCIEYNCFNASGWYDCDDELIVQSITDYVKNIEENNE